MGGEEYVKKTLLLGTVIILATLSFFVIKPFIITIISSMVLAYILNPAYQKLKRISKSANISAGIISLFIFIIFLASVWFLTPLLVRQTFNIYTTIQKVDFVAPLRQIAPKFFTSPEFTRDFTVTVNALVIKIANSIMAKFESAITELPFIVANLIILLFVFFFTLRDEDKIVALLKDLSPFDEETEKKFIKQFNNITKSVLYGMFIVGAIQGLVAGFGFYVFGIPRALFLTIVAIFFGILPILGPFMLWVPLGIGILLTGKISVGILFLLYNLFTTLLVNFFIGPKIIQKGAHIPQIIALIGMLGGGYFFGIIGLIVGPLILSYLLLFLDFYRNKKLHQLFGLSK